MHANTKGGCGVKNGLKEDLGTVKVGRGRGIQKSIYLPQFLLWTSNSFEWHFCEWQRYFWVFPVIGMFELKTKRLHWSHPFVVIFFRYLIREAVWCSKGFSIGRQETWVSVQGLPLNFCVTFVRVLYFQGIGFHIYLIKQSACFCHSLVPGVGG